MLVYRVFWYQEGAKEGESGSPFYINSPQGDSRWDNPESYVAWYVAKTPEAAVGESFGDRTPWQPSMFDTGLPATRRAIAVFSLPQDIRVFDLDDPAHLVDLAMRPSQVVVRNPPFTQRRAASIFKERDTSGKRRWHGLQWWSYHHPGWTNIMVWQPPDEECKLTLREIIPLDLGVPAVIDAAEVLRRDI